MSILLYLEGTLVWFLHKIMWHGFESSLAHVEPQQYLGAEFPAHPLLFLMAWCDALCGKLPALRLRRMYCHDVCFYKRLKIGFCLVDIVGNGLYSDVNCVWQKLLRQLSESCHWKCLAWKFISLLLQRWGFQQDSCGVNPSSHIVGKQSQAWFYSNIVSFSVTSAWLHIL